MKIKQKDAQIFFEMAVITSVSLTHLKQMALNPKTGKAELALAVESLANSTSRLGDNHDERKAKYENIKKLYKGKL
jgi:hypothetical protein